MGRLSNKKGRPSRYRKSLKNNDYWNTVKREVRLRDNHRCQICGRDYNLEIHHKVYSVNGVSILGKELDYLNCLTTLCEECHENIHKDKKQKTSNKRQGNSKN